MRRLVVLALLACGCQPHELRPGSDAFVSDPRVARDPIEPGPERRLAYDPEVTVPPEGSALSWFRDAGALDFEETPLFR